MWTEGTTTPLRKDRPVLVILQTIAKSRAPDHAAAGGMSAARALRTLVTLDTEGANKELMEAERQFLLAVNTATEALVEKLEAAQQRRGKGPGRAG